MPIEWNPYQPTSVDLQAPVVEHSPQSLPLAICAGVGFFAFLAFTIVLLRSSPVDRQVGMLFLANLPILLWLAISLGRSTRFGAMLGLAAATIQGLIVIVMLVARIGDLIPVLMINGIIVVPMLLIALFAWLSWRRSTVAHGGNASEGLVTEPIGIVTHTTALEGERRSDQPSIINGETRTGTPGN